MAAFTWIPFGPSITKGAAAGCGDMEGKYGRGLWDWQRSD